MKSVYLILACMVLAGCSTRNKTAQTPLGNDFIVKASGLKYKIIKEGTGDPAKEGKEVLIFETTTYLNGTVLYTNENSANPVKILIGGHQATDAVDEGLRGMKIGEIRQLIAPPHLVKRTTYPDNVSPDSTLSIKLILHKIL